MSDIASQAADWLVRITEDSPPPSAEELAEFNRWQAADPRHRKAIAQLQKLMGSIQAAPSDAAHAALNASSQDSLSTSWAGLAKVMTIIIALLLPFTYYANAPLFNVWLADKHTDNQQWQSWSLEDASTLYLSGNSAVDIDYSPEQRRLNLLQGELLIDVAKDSERPLEVMTEHGRFRALGTRFIVQRKHGQSVLTVLESTVQAQYVDESAASAGLRLTAGEQINLSTPALGQLNQDAITKVDVAKFERNWKAGQYVVSGEPLSQVLDELSHYHRGLMLFDTDTLATIKVMAVLPLNDPERALQLLSESLPITINQYSPWITYVAMQEP